MPGGTRPRPHRDAERQEMETSRLATWQSPFFPSRALPRRGHDALSITVPLRGPPVRYVVGAVRTRLSPGRSHSEAGCSAPARKRQSNDVDPQRRARFVSISSSLANHLLPPRRRGSQSEKSVGWKRKSPGASLQPGPRQRR
jgi:hypothetical protein